MIYGSACSGIEAAYVAWHALDWTPAWFAQHDPDHNYKSGPDFASKILAHHYPHVENRGDITRFEEWPHGPIDLLVGGTPCQDFSIAGLREGLAGARGNLALTFVAMAGRFGPRWILWENVPGVLSSGGGRDFAAILGGLAGRTLTIPRQRRVKDEGGTLEPWTEDAGWTNSGIIEPAGPDCYGLAWRVLDAQYFGLAQRRKRVFVVGYLGDWRPAAAVLFEQASLYGDPPPRREAREDSTHATAPSLTASGRGVERAGESRGQDPVVAHPLTTGGGAEV